MKVEKELRGEIINRRTILFEIKSIIHYSACEVSENISLLWFYDQNLYRFIHSSPHFVYLKA